MHAAARLWCKAMQLAVLCGPVPAWSAQYSCDSADTRNHVLRMKGGVEDGEFARFKGAYAQCFPASYAGQPVVDLHSGGGRVDEALDIANALIAVGQRGTPILTRISRGNYCISACTYLFISGRMREVQPGGSLEPHGFSSYRGGSINRTTAAATVDGSLQPQRVELRSQLPRFLATTTGPFTSTDERFAWLGAWVKDFGRTDGRILRTAPATLIQDYIALSGPRRTAVDRMDAILTVVMTELQRVAALKAFEPLLRSGQGSSGLAGLIGEEEESRLSNWLLREFLSTFNLYISEAKLPGGALKGMDIIAATVRDLQRAEIRDTTSTVTEQLWPFLKKREDVLDMDGFVRLMFSTSIIYMRPLTREELCDFNLISTACD